MYDPSATGVRVSQSRERDEHIARGHVSGGEGDTIPLLNVDPQGEMHVKADQRT